MINLGVLLGYVLEVTRAEKSPTGRPDPTYFCLARAGPKPDFQSPTRPEAREMKIRARYKNEDFGNIAQKLHIFTICL